MTMKAVINQIATQTSPYPLYSATNSERKD